MQAETMDYTAKNEARNWTWNQIKSRLKKIPFPIPRARILFLSAKEPKDIETAIRKGFKSPNLYGLEADPKAISEARRRHVNVIPGQAQNTIANWPENEPLHGIILDFNSGLESATLACALALNMSKAVTQNTIIVANFFKGREHIDIEHFAPITRLCGNNRAAWFLGAILEAPFAPWAKAYQRNDDFNNLPKEEKKRHLREYAHLAIDVAQPDFREYKTQSGKTMQMVAFRFPHNGATQEYPDEPRAEDRHTRDKRLHLLGQIKAARAVATMRRNGTRPTHFPN